MASNPKTGEKAHPEYRRATLEDYEGVMDINRNIYNGHDYLPDQYDRYVSDSFRLAYVAVIDGKIVAFRCGTLLDDGECLVGEAERTHIDFQGRGLMRGLVKHSTQDITAQFPGIKYITYTSSNLATQEKRLNMASAKYELRMVNHKEALNARCTFDNLAKICQQQHGQITGSDVMLNKARLLADDQALSILQSIKWNTICPSSYLVVNWIPYHIRKSNFQRIIQTPGRAIVYLNNDGHESMSFGTYCKVQAGNMYYIDYYGPTDSSEEIKAHYLKHLRNLHNILQNHEDQVNVITSFLKQDSPGSKHLDQLEEFVYNELGFSQTSGHATRLQILHMMEPNIHSI